MIGEMYKCPHLFCHSSMHPTKTSDICFNLHLHWFLHHRWHILWLIYWNWLALLWMEVGISLHQGAACHMSRWTNHFSSRSCGSAWQWALLALNSLTLSDPMIMTSIFFSSYFLTMPTRWTQMRGGLTPVIYKKKVRRSNLNKEEFHSPDMLYLLMDISSRLEATKHYI